MLKEELSSPEFIKRKLGETRSSESTKYHNTMGYSSFGPNIQVQDSNPLHGVKEEGSIENAVISSLGEVAETERNKVVHTDVSKQILNSLDTLKEGGANFEGVNAASSSPLQLFNKQKLL